MPLPIFVPLCYDFFQDYWVARQALTAVQGQEGPKQVSLSEFDPEYALRPFQEIAVNAGQTVGAGILPGDKIDFSFVLIQSSEQPNAYMALYGEAYLQDLLLERLAGTREANGSVLLRGFLIEGRGIENRIHSLLADEGIELDGPLYVMEPFFGDRADALKGHLSDKRLFFLITVSFTMVFIMVATFKFVTWRRRVVAKRETVPVTGSVTEARARPAMSAAKIKTSVSKRSKDQFENSPILSKKGWFR